jgi:outer membrane protein OmpA-like peptidoglycan-associated protein
LLLGKGHVSAQLDETGRLNWLSLLPPQPTTNEPKAAPAAAEAANAAPTKPWHLAVDQFKLGELALDVTDDSHKAPLKASLGALSLGFKVDAVAGSDAPQAIISNIDASLDRLAVIETQTETSLLKWDSLKLEQGQVDVAKQAASIRRLVLNGGGTAVAREANGAIYPVSLFESDSSPQPQIPATPKKLGAVKSTTAEKSWLFNLGEMAIHDFGLGVKDKSPVGTLAYNLDAINASVKNVSNAGKTPLNFKLGTTIRQGGALSLAGTAAPTGEHAKTQITLDRFSLVQLQPYLSEFAALKLQSANLSTHLAVDFQQATPTPKIRVTGDANLANLDLPQSRDGKKFLAWGDLNTHGIDFSLTPDKLTIKELKLVEPDSVIAIHQDKSSNISDIIRPRKAAAPPSAQASHGSGKSQPAFPVSIGRIVVEKGKVDFSDASLVLPFATRVHDFGGSIAGFALTPQSRMTLQLAGKVDEFGETRVDGSLSPLDIKQFSDINVIFRNVTMSSLSPYSATFAGRRIESGKLDLDLQYRIENHQLKSQNKITLEQFRLGEQVESPNATSLPLDLAIALLTDAEGKIQASVPVEGTLDDPKFAYGTVVWDAFTTLIKNAATAPFKALVSLVGSRDGDPGTVAFDAGRSEIPPPEREKLQKLAASLASKGQLKLTIHGGIDAKADAAALKVLAVRRLVANQLDIELKPGEMPDPVNIADAASQRVLEKLAAESGAADSVAAAYAREKGRPPERMGAMSGLLGRPSQTPDFYEQLLASLEEKTELPAGQLQALAEQRAKAVMSELLERQRFDRQRAVIGPVEDAQETADRRVAIRLDLGV